MGGTLRAAGIVWAALLVGCAAPAPIRVESIQTSHTIRERARALEAWAREQHQRPLPSRIYLSNAASRDLMLPARRSWEEALAVEQLDAIQVACARDVFDLYGVELSLVEGGARAIELDAETGWLRLTLPATGPGADVAAVSADELLRALAEPFAWDALGGWWREEERADLLAALGHDLRRLDALEDELRVRCGQLELLAGTLAARDAEALTASEHMFARQAQLHAQLALQRVLNVLSRWRTAWADPAFPLPTEAGVASVRARLIHDAYLTWLLDLVVGGRSATRFWTRGFWHRNLLYKALDAGVDLTVAGGGEHVDLPEGSIRALLGLRIEGDLRDHFDALDAAAPELAPALGQSPLAPALRAAWERNARTRQTLAAHDLSGFSAWKELWDARLKGAFRFPLYQVVVAVATLVGDTRLSLRDPAIRPEQLAELAPALRPGDIVLVRQDGFLSNALLPGFWTHAALYLGPREAWGALQLADGRTLADDPAVRAAWSAWERPLDDGHPPAVLEAVSEGVVFSSLEHALGKDYVVVLRPRIPRAELAAGLRRALACWGRPYDFDFDFASDDRLVCTELVYRAYDPQLNLRVQLDAELPPVEPVPGLMQVMGRLTLPANELARYALYMYDHVQPSVDLGYPGRRLELIRLFDREGDEARAYDGLRGWPVLRESVGR